MNNFEFNRIGSTMICLTMMLILTVSTTTASPMQQAQTDFTAINSYIEEQMNEMGIPGMALAIVKDGQIAHLQGFGTADSSGRAVTPQTPFHIGSLTKSFTALAVLQLVEAGKIDLDASVQTYLPWFELADKEASAQITVRNLLNQASGISTKDGNRFWTSQQGLEETVRSFNSIQLTQPVGTTFQYSNSNFMTAGLIVEEVSGQSYADYVTEHIFEPLDMDHSYASRSTAQADGLAEGHHYMFGQVFKDDGPFPPSLLPTGFLIASIEDMAHYMIAQLNDGQYGETSLLSPQGTAEMHSPAIPVNGGESHVAMGWSVGTHDGVTVFTHNGDTGRSHAYAFGVPEQNLGFVLLTNTTGFEEMHRIDKILNNIVLNMVFDEPLAPVAPHIGLLIQYWGILLTPFLQILGIFLIWRKRQRIKWWGVVLVVAVNLAVVFSLFQLALQIITLPSLLVFYPELGNSLVITAALGIGWSVAYSAITLVTRRAQ